jgi:carboxypeptidase C (cathepsin A)
VTTAEPTRAGDHQPPPGASITADWDGLDYVATSGWIVLRKDDKPAAEVFSTSYVASAGDPGRPVTFLFNGGPGAASAYVHIGAIGPRRVELPEDGTLPTMPPRLVHNAESWLAFTDLVFVDPVGTGFSRVIPGDSAGADKDKAPGEAPDPKEYFGVRRDLDAMCEFVARWLSDNDRWGSAVFVAGESYGGYRVGRLTRLLQEKGIALNGAILISPALEPGALTTHFPGYGDYDVTPWIDILPTMAASAAFHGRSRVFPAGTAVADVQRAAEEFATGDYPTLLTRGAAMAAEERQRILQRFADFTGLDLAYVTRAEGRVRVDQFARELLRDEGKVVGRYDAAITTTDPFPDRDVYSGSDPTLMGIGPAYTTAINQQLRSVIGVDTTREYTLLSVDVTMAWKNDEAAHYVQHTHGAVDDFRYGMAMSPHVRAFITHGRFDLMTPYFSTDRLRNLMRLDPTVADRLTVMHFDGGPMFYSWKASRQAFTAAIARFMQEAVGS